MQARISLITLGVEDLQASLRFYRDGLGLATQGVVGTEFEDGAVVFFDLQGGLKLALFPRQSLAKDAGIPLATGGGACSIAHNVNSQTEVDAVMKQAALAGASIIKPAQSTFWGGYSGYFRDPDSHLWEVAWNPQWTFPDD